MAAKRTKQTFNTRVTDCGWCARLEASVVYPSAHIFPYRAIMGVPQISAKQAVIAAFVVNGAILGTWGSRVPAIIERHGLSESSFSVLLLLMGLGALTAFQTLAGVGQVDAKEGSAKK